MTTRRTVMLDEYCVGRTREVTKGQQHFAKRLIPTDDKGHDRQIDSRDELSTRSLGCSGELPWLRHFDHCLSNPAYLSE